MMGEQAIQLREDGSFGHVIEVTRLGEREFFIEIDNEVNSLCMIVDKGRVHDFAQQLLDMSKSNPKDAD